MKFLILFALLSCSSLVAKVAPLETVQSVDINRYLGKWYEIARFDQKFQKNCTAVTAEYSLIKSSTIKVVNKCRLFSPDGKRKVANGRAWIKDKKTNSKLKVQFFLSRLRLGFLAGDYWIIALGDNYEYAMVGAPDRKYLWILSRRPSLDDDTLNMLKNKAQEQGFDTTKLLMTTH